MTYYYKQINESGKVVTLSTYGGMRRAIHNPLVVEITEDEYNAILAEIEAQQPDEPETDEISAEEALNIITGGADA